MYKRTPRVNGRWTSLLAATKRGAGGQHPGSEGDKGRGGGEKERVHARV